MRSRLLFVAVLTLLVASSVLAGFDVPKDHPHVLGSRDQLKALAKAKPEEFRRVEAVARDASTPTEPRVISLSLVAVVNDDAEAAREAQRLVMKLINGPIRRGHVTFGTDLALCGIVYDLCHEAWSESDREKFFDYFSRTVDANVQSETHVFHNAWYSYKNWGYGIAAMATYHEYDRAPEILSTLDKDYRTRAVPALELAGNGGGWAEGYYIHYWTYEWLFFCEVAKRCAGVDYYAPAPKFYKNRALASAFETYPGISTANTRRPVPSGDGRGRVLSGDRDEALSSRRILVNHYRDDPLHQAIHSFNELTPRSGISTNAYRDFLWRDTTVPKRPLGTLPLSHYAPGPGFVYARSSWDEDATYFFFKAGDRFTAHQHLDNGHFLIYRKGELAGDGGHYEAFGSNHDANYQLRTIAHSTMLVHDPAEKWPDIRRSGVRIANDGGQHHDWPHHNGAASDVDDWLRNKPLYDIADITAFADMGDYLYVSSDLTHSYSDKKVARFTRQIAYVRPGTFVILDHVTSKRPEFQKTWLLQAVKVPEEQDGRLVLTSGEGKLFIQTLLPANPKIHVVRGDDLYRYDAGDFSPRQEFGPAPEARVEVSPTAAAESDTFLHVLTAADATGRSVPAATFEKSNDGIEVKVDGKRILFRNDGRNVTVE